MSDAADSAQAPAGPASPLMPMIVRTDHGEGDHRQATWLELFFDLCFVVAIAGVARALHADPTWSGALIYVGLFAPLWWAWMGFTWFSNSFDNDDLPYRAVIFAAMLAIVWFASSIQAAALGNVTAYVLAYIALRALLLGLMLRARRSVSKHPDESTHEQAAGFLDRYITFNTLGLTFWSASLLFDEPFRYVLWGIGLALELWAPHSSIRPLWADAEVDHERFFHFDHIRERYGLFTIIVLGESILAVTVGIQEVGWDAESMLTGSLAFLAAVSIWWIYFDRAGRDALGASEHQAFAWGYGHFAIFAGIAALGVGTELLIEAAGQPEAIHAAAGEAGAGAAAEVSHHLPGPSVFAGGLVAFLAGMTFINLANLGFTITQVGRWILPLRFALSALIVGIAWLADPSPLVFAAIAGPAMVCLNTIETVLVLRFQRERAAPAAANP